MNKAAVYIATTAGPVRIERITVESVPWSEVFVGRGYKPLEHISSDYDKFVRIGGPIDRAFVDVNKTDDGSYRMDISGQIDAGNSWELAVLIAHGLNISSRLADIDDTPDEVIFLTGKVDTDLNISSVGHIFEKLKAAKLLIDDCVVRNCPICFVAPLDDQMRLGVDEDINVLQVENVQQVLKVLELGGKANELRATAPMHADEEKRKIISRPSLFVLMVLAILIGAVSLMVTGDFDINSDKAVSLEEAIEAITSSASSKAEPSMDQPVDPLQQPKSVQLATTEPEPTITQVTYPKISIIELRAPVGRTCAGVQFGRDTPLEVLVNVKNMKATASPLNGLCGLKFIAALGSEDTKGAFVFSSDMGRFLTANVGFPLSLGVHAFTGNKEWLIDFPKRMDENFRYRVGVLMGEIELLKYGEQLYTEENWFAAVEQNKIKGIKFDMIDHEVKR